MLVKSSLRRRHIQGSCLVVFRGFKNKWVPFFFWRKTKTALSMPVRRLGLQSKTVSFYASTQEHLQVCRLHGRLLRQSRRVLLDLVLDIVFTQIQQWDSPWRTECQLWTCSGKGGTHNYPLGHGFWMASLVTAWKFPWTNIISSSSRSIFPYMSNH